MSQNLQNNLYKLYNSTMEQLDSLAEAAKKKEAKKPSKWKFLSVTKRHGKVKDIKFSTTDGLPPEQVVNREKQAGQGHSGLGYAKGEVTKQ